MSTLINCSPKTQSGQNETATPTTSSDQVKVSTPAQSTLQQPIRPKLYLEHSGSMLGYDGSSIDSSHVRDAVLKLINTFSRPVSIPISIVNDTIYPYPQSLAALIRSSNLFKSKIGDPDNTDFHKIFTSITASLRENELAILTTDLIHSNVGGDEPSAGRVRSNAHNLARLALGNYAKDGALLIMQLTSEFSGDYYTYKNPTTEIPYRGNRPIYILLFARNATMDRLLTEPTYANLRKFSDYPGFQNVLLFSNSVNSRTPFYTLEEHDPDAKGTYNNDREGNRNNNGIHAIKDLVPPIQGNQKLTLCVAAELPATYGANELLDTANYEVKSLQDGFKLKAVKIAKGRRDKATHRLLLEASHPGGSSPRKVTIRLKRNFPPRWVRDTDTGDDTRPDPKTDFARTTFGLLPLLTGINEAYENHVSDRNFYFTCTLYLN